MLPISELLNSFNKEFNWSAGFIPKIQTAKVSTNREEIMADLQSLHPDLLPKNSDIIRRAEQIHGKEIALVQGINSEQVTTLGVDGLITGTANVQLGIYVADCAAVWLIDPQNRVLGLVHSGKQGTLKNICGEAISQMENLLGANPKIMHAIISPCIRPPWYELDIPAKITEELLDSGLLGTHIHDCKTCTFSESEIYCSYRKEKGATSRMLAYASLH